MARHLPRAAVTSLVCASLFAAPMAGVALADPAPAAPTGFSWSPGQVADAPRLSSMDNFRDVAGTGAGYTGFGGEHLNKGVFYRANAFTPNDADLATLGGLGLKKVYDLRTDPEVAAKPDRLPAGAEYVRVPIISGDITNAARKLRSPAEAVAFMENMNRSFVTGEAERAGFKKLLTDLANSAGPQAFHCTSGKDRTGWTSYLLLSLVGVSRDTIMSDYLLTNEYSAGSIAAMRAQIAQAYGEQAAIIFTPLLGVQASYLNAGITALEQQYGSVRNYLKTGLGLNDATLAKLALRMLD
ncbi:tyrosine-protein phosphatase [Rhodococcus daqingensis]|uniref:Tyrosine-protein phosphatase n=1 Tax=Rhodococcus daqingensis TaxID=2479363 RepID=A0ABW2RS92_9NOCA